MIGDRAYGSRVGITHVLKNKGDYLVRIKNKAMTLMETEEKEFNLLAHFHKLEIGEIGDWDVLYSPGKNKRVKIRLCMVNDGILFLVVIGGFLCSAV